ncbi:GGDEF domain-containing protein [Rhodoferax saidenbachensis]|uniref:GGDEF domain-containing protein n=1 Tax=Rhodoferax saidenbachensis TaxID=1484693 RepID=A0A1P8K6S9_9BURK|nr:GGDEF domain-containing protein [Rhodoferax saidenbachensis]APW41722.1 GGDEF domain-containing protein [Rhodoferax saidenbachensis]
MRTTIPGDGSDSGGLSEADSFRARRLKQIASFTALALAARLVVNMAIGSPFNATQIELTAGLGLVLLSLWLARRNALDNAGLLLLASLSAMAGALVWSNEGMYDTALLAFPGLLIFCGLLLPLRYFYGLLALMLGFIFILGWRTMAGIHVPVVDPSYTQNQRTLDLLLILALSGLCVQMMISDLHKALHKSQQSRQELEQSQANLTYMAQHDALTGLPNRRMGRDRISQAMQHARRRGSHVAVLFVDLDNFKSINDVYGHDFGDKFLKSVAERLLAAVREADIVSRQGGDEFVIGITDVVDSKVIPAVALKVLSLLREPVSFDGQGVFASCSIGIAIFPDDGDNFDALMQLADQAMYQAKKSGRNTYCFSTPQQSDTLDLVAPEIS